MANKKLKDTPKKKRELGVVLEDIDANVKQTLELAHTHSKQINEIQKDVGSLKKDTTQLKDDVAVIKLAVQGTEDEMPLRQELSDVKKRVSQLETKTG